MLISKDRTDIDGVRFRCGNCRKTKSIRDGSFFTKSHLGLKVILMIIFCWSKKVGICQKRVYRLL